VTNRRRRPTGGNPADQRASWSAVENLINSDALTLTTREPIGIGASRRTQRFWDVAHGGAGEIRGALDLADAWGWQVESVQARALLDRELGLLWGSPPPPRDASSASGPRRSRGEAEADPAARR
jgi:hypothetical protein